MAEKSIDIVSEKIERLEVRRNTSNQIISYTLPDDSEKLYGIHRISGDKTAFPLNDFDRVIYSKPSELVNPIPQFEIEVVRRSTINPQQFIEVRLLRESISSNPNTLSPISAVSQFRPIAFGSTTTG